MLTQNDINLMLQIISTATLKGDDTLDLVYQLKCKLKAIYANQEKNSDRQKVAKE